MKRIDIVEDTVAAIESCKSRAKSAMRSGELALYARLMGDILALEVSLVPEAKRLAEEHRMLLKLLNEKKAA